MISDTSTLALNVISSVAFENHQVNEPIEGHTLSLRESLVTVMSTSISPAIEGIMPWLQWSGLQILLPKSIKALLHAMAEFRQYMDEIVARERHKEKHQEGRGHLNLIQNLLKANDELKAEDNGSKARLSDVELRGNVFIFTVGGLESTSITLSYALALLAINPDIQDWAVEEVQKIMANEGDLDYTRCFPKLKRVMAIMVHLPYTPLSPPSHLIPTP